MRRFRIGNISQRFECGKVQLSLTLDGLNAFAVKFVGGFPGTGKKKDKARKKSTSHYVKTIVKDNLAMKK